MPDDKPVTYQRNLRVALALLPLLSGNSGWGGAGVWSRGKSSDFLALEPQRPASLTDPSTWCDYAPPLAAWQAGHADGIAYVMTEADPFAAIELVHCRHPARARSNRGAEFPRRGAQHLYGSNAKRRRLPDLGSDRRRHRAGASEIHGRDRGKQVVAELCRRTPKVLTVTGYRLDTVDELTSLDRAFDWAVVWGKRRTAAAQANGQGEPEPEPPPPSDAHEDHDLQPGAERDRIKQNVLDAALDYARRGWPVFPCKPTNKAPFIEGGLNAATTDEETIRGWWGQWPHAMIGVPMGSRSGVWAVDPDPPKKPDEPDGREIWAA